MSTSAGTGLCSRNASASSDGRCRNGGANTTPQQKHLYSQLYALGTGVGVLLPYSRKNESEADKIGMILMAKAGYDPAEALHFWKRMEAATKGKSRGGSLEKFMSTHPTSRDRQAQIKAWLPEMIRYQQTDIGHIGFHAIPLHVSDNSPYMTTDELGTRLSGGCQRQHNLDAQFMWYFANVGTTVVVI